ncbi:MAG: TonB-dependent receptor plug domain-containing protein, partial [Ignavibacteriales bacterium]|nr:TonB-dependent receptor plug domain-containing protein [Ignavibacteriales bacterium]
YQASSLKDVLELAPGVAKTDNPGLGKTSQAALRGDEDDALSAFGTLIVVDGAPVSNNANLQFERLTGSKFGGSNLGKGVDLRTIPADNIEEIEVITGLPSVKYGDLSSGIINIKSKIGASPTRLKVKSNPNTSEANLGGGYHVFENSSFSYNLNGAQAERDIRVTGDEYLRLTGDVTFNHAFSETFIHHTKVNVQSVLDEEEPKGDAQQTRNYNRGFSVRFTNWGEFSPTELATHYDYNLYASYRRENTMKSRLVQSDLRVMPNGDTVSTYMGKVETRGVEWTIGGRFLGERVFYTGDFIHKTLFGVEPQYNVNTGEGVIFDTLYSYYGAASARRPYYFDDIPGQLLASAYVEDKITGKLGVDFSLTLGFRYEMYRPQSFNLSGLWGDGELVESQQGTFFNPRASLMFYFADYSQLRLSAGRSSKSPPMSRLYPPEEVYEWRNPVSGETMYLRYDQHSPNLQGYREELAEISYDHKFFDEIGLTLSAYYKERRGAPNDEPVPVFIEAVDSFGVSNVFYVDYYGMPQNIGKNFTRGLEFSIRTRKIEPLNMTFRIVGSYNYIDDPGAGVAYSANPDPSVGQYPNYVVPGVNVDTTIGWTYPSGGDWQERIQLNYYVSYTHPDLGLWVTLRAEQAVSERYQYYGKPPVDYSMMTPEQIVDYEFSKETKTRPSKWLFSFNVSKSLFEGAEASFYVNNFMDDPAVYRYWTTPTQQAENSRNPDLFYGVQFSMVVDRLLGASK